MARLSLSPDAPPSPSPPHSVTSAPTNKTSRIHARRLRLSQASSEHLADVGRKRRVLQTATPAAETDLSCDGVQHLGRTSLPPVMPVPHIPRPPLTRALHGGLVKSGYEINTRYFSILFFSPKILNKSVSEQQGFYFILATVPRMFVIKCSLD